MKILMVDDSQTIRNNPKSALSAMGYRKYLEAADGTEALAILEGERPDLVLIDSDMPKMDGITLTRRIRETDANLPPIMVSTEVGKDRVLEALRSGASHYVVKPCSAETLSAKIKQAMARAARTAS